jgi:phage gpG-like protein
MSDDLLKIDFKFPDWKGKLLAQEERLNLFAAAQIQANRGMLFDTEGAHNGHKKWAPLQLRNGQILSKRGTLRKSIAPSNPKGSPGSDGIVRFTSDAIVVGTTLGYARMMNDGTAKMPGGVLRAKNAKALRIPLPAGDWANDKARSLRAGRTLEQIEKLHEASLKAQDRAERARARFVTGGSDKQLAATIRAERAVASKAERLGALQERAEKIAATGKGGDGFIFRKSVKIPPRNFTDWNEQDQAEVDAAFVNKVRDILNG